jgi:hypothetical protein
MKMPRIPKILHYTFGLAQDFGGKPWSLVHHVCLKSAIERIRPERVYLYYEFEPRGAWWALSRDLVTPVRIKAPREIFGKTVGHVAHRADVVRLQKLIEHGGIYLDSDVLVQCSFDDLLNESTVLGAEGNDTEFGVANAIILAEPEARFLIRWLDSYRSFRGEGRKIFWNEHSVQLPSKLAKAYPSEVTVLPHTAFYWPLWTPEHIQWIFNSTKTIPLDNTYANHLWESKGAPFLEKLTPGVVRSKDTNFHLWARPFLHGLPDNYGIPTMKENAVQLKHRTVQCASGLKSKIKRRAAAFEREINKLLLSEDQIRRRRRPDQSG